MPSLVLLAQFFAHAAGIVQAGSRLLWGRGMSLLELQGTCLACLLATLWVLAGRARQRELERQRRRGGQAAPSGSLAALAAEQEVRCRRVWFGLEGDEGGAPGLPDRLGLSS